MGNEETSTIGLPMTESSEAWMEDVGEDCCFDDSGDENELKPISDVAEEAKLKANSVTNEETSTIGLPMMESSDAWMEDVGEGCCFDDSEDENELKPNSDVAEESKLKANSVPIEETSSIGLPMTE